MFTRTIRIWTRTLIFWWRFTPSHRFRRYLSLEWITMCWWRASTAWVRLMRYYTQLSIATADILDQGWLHVFLDIIRIKWTVYLWTVIFKSVISTAIRNIFLFQIRLTIGLTQDVAVLPIKSLIRATLDFSIWICKSIVGIFELLVSLLLVPAFIVVLGSKVCRLLKLAKILLTMASGMSTRERSSWERIRNRTSLPWSEWCSSAITLTSIRLARAIVG